MRFQVTVDAERPHELAEWWAETLGWEVEPSNEEFIRKMVDEGFATEDQTMTYKGVLVWKGGAAINRPDGQRMLFQEGPEGRPGDPTTGPSMPERRHNRMHLDLRLGDADRDEVVATLIARGATKLWDGRQGPHTWVTMADPEGNEFCVA
ncbi:VOC family protein [Allocatelliglobosispora scoriae]|nr:VOC family protein [Allocatelliglobosispora scoriae]